MKPAFQTLERPGPPCLCTEALRCRVAGVEVLQRGTDFLVDRRPARSRGRGKQATRVKAKANTIVAANADTIFSMLTACMTTPPLRTQTIADTNDLAGSHTSIAVPSTFALSRVDFRGRLPEF
jgi:hypothetical protein